MNKPLIIDESCAHEISLFELQKSILDDKKQLIFEKSGGFDQALSDGFFLIKQPEGIDLTAGDIFAQNFYKRKEDTNSELDKYKGFHVHTPDKFDAPHEGYYLREVDQTEQFFLEKKYWEKIYPLPLVRLANQLNNFAVDILKNVLSYIDVPEPFWNIATGECVNNNGTHHLTFNHFRPEKNARGLNIHKDSGWVTVLRSIEPGLEAYIDGSWRKIYPKNGYFIVNFGCAMEILSSNLSKPVSAIVHRVVQQMPTKDNNKVDRFSYALFTDNSLDEKVCSGLYSYDKNSGLNLKMNFRKFLDEILNATYREDTVGLY